MGETPMIPIPPKVWLLLELEPELELENRLPEEEELLLESDPLAVEPVELVADELEPNSDELDDELFPPEGPTPARTELPPEEPAPARG